MSDAATGTTSARPPEAGSRAEASDWDRFLAPASSVEFVEAWFALLCRELTGVTRAVLLLETTEGRFAPAARWPRDATGPDADGEALQTACAAAQETGEAAFRTCAGDRRAGALPVAVAGRVQAVLGFVVPGAMVVPAVRRAQWGLGWLHGMIAERGTAEHGAHADDLGRAVAVLAALEDGATLEAALRALTNEIQPLIGADRVAVALLRRGRLRLRALSQTAEVERKSGVSRTLVQAMEEARFQVRSVVWPDDSPIAVTAAHAAHGARAGSRAMISVPLLVRGELLGVVSAERMVAGSAPFDAADLARLEDVLDLSAPLIGLKMRGHRLISGRLPHWAGVAVGALLGRRHPGVKAIALAVCGLVAWLALAQTPLRVTAPAQLQGEVSRVATVPFDGFVDSAPARAGDTVTEGEILARLDDRDLRLELLKWESEAAKLAQERNAALAQGDRAALGQLAARIARVAAETDLARSRLDRIEIRAPLSGLIVEGDLTQQLGAPVAKGDALFRIASGDAFRLSLEIGEYDVHLVTPGAQGTLALAGLSARPIGFEVTRLAEVATAEAGGTAFRAEARLIDPPAGLRPGLEGVAKVTVGEASVLWSMWRPMAERTRVLIWRWRP